MKRPIKNDYNKHGDEPRIDEMTDEEAGRGGAGQHVYVVVENGDLYPTLYSTYEKAHAAVTTKYSDELSDERESAASCGGKMASES
jgi:hypothetical protein